MSSFGKIVGSVASFSNENTLALLNVNLDFSIFRCDPIAEFLPVGSALTKKRREEAESGPTHRTANILGFLFNDVVPEVPQLTKAFGKRVSDILSHPDINPLGTEDDGPFRPFIGADCTSIWAAATSGNAAIAVLLLACMLANAFDAKSAVSIWSQLIEERKQRVRSQAEGGKMMNPNTLAAAQQEVNRSQLRMWDASARSWLRRADLSMSRQKTQFTLIVENITIPYPGGGEMYEQVTETWTRAMEVMENLLNNNPQQACDRAVISGIPSWHLYPDLVVFQTDAKKIQFDDALVPRSGILSLGLEFNGTPSENFIRWSLALSHLRYYGDPIKVRSSETLRRIQMSQLWLPTLGAILCIWQAPYTSIEHCMAWFEVLEQKINLSSAKFGVELSWVLQLCSAVTSIDKNDKDVALKLIKYGYRRGTRLLGGSDKIGTQTPFFGLCNPAALSALEQENEIEIGIEFLRQISSRLGLESHEAVISCDGKLHEQTYFEWVSISPFEAHLVKPRSTFVLSESHQKSNARWIHYESSKNQPLHGDNMQHRLMTIEARGELCEAIEDKMLQDAEDAYRWDHPPMLFDEQGNALFTRIEGPSVGFGSFDFWMKKSKYCSRASSAWGTMIDAALAETMTVEQGVTQLRKLPPERVVTYLLFFLYGTRPTHGTNELNSKRKRPATASFSRKNPNTNLTQDSGCFSLLTNHIPRSTELIVHLRALEVANRLYHGLPGVTVSLRVVEVDILKAAWLPQSIKDILRMNETAPVDAFRMAVRMSVEEHFQTMKRENLFACVAMFESGHANIEPKHLNEVIALCYEDSIFVSEILLSDPSIEHSKLRLRHMVGNVGHAGMVLMVSPCHPRIRPLESDADAVEHSSYNFQSIDSLQGTSLHLSFTTWKMALEWETTGEIDQEIFLLESVVSVQHSGRWVADIDVLGIEKDCPDVVSFGCDCPVDQRPPWLDAVSLDSWEELLDYPPCVGILRAKSDWAARLAASSILIQQGQGHVAVIVDGERICWNCLKETYAEPEPHLPRVVIF